MTERLHGEYKTPGGKLTVVDFQLTADRMTNVQISGDFFAYPDDLPRRLQAVLEGALATDEFAALAHRLSVVVSDGDLLLGSGPEAVAHAVMRALEETAPT